MTEIMEALAEVFSFEPDSEMSIEANPGTVNLEKLKTYEKIGLNRISFGLQSAHNEELKALGRIHTWEEFLECDDRARQAGFGNINVDLMSGIPDQTLSSWQKTLSRVLELAPEHVSAYSLIVEEGTPFAQRKLNLPEEEEERRMYEMTAEMLGRSEEHTSELQSQR